MPNPLKRVLHERGEAGYLKVINKSVNHDWKVKRKKNRLRKTTDPKVRAKLLRQIAELEK